MRPKILRIDPYAATDPNAISISQTPAAGGVQELTITGALASGGIATMDTPRQVLLTFVADESSRKFIVTGRDSKGNNMVEALAGTATTAKTVKAFTTVTSIKIDNDSAGAIEAGTDTVIWTNWVIMNYESHSFEASLGLDIGSAAATPDFTVEMTLSNILRQQGNLSESWVNLAEFDQTFPSHSVFDHSTMVNMAANTTGNLDFPVMGVRLKSNGVFTTGGVSLEILHGYR